MRPHPLLALFVAATTSVACVTPPRAAAAPGTGTLASPADAPAPTTTDASMPPSLPPPAAPQSALQTNTTYQAGSILVGVGGGLALVGAVFAGVGALTRCSKVDPTSQSCATQSDVQSNQSVSSTFVTIGLAGLIVGGVILVAGIPFVIVGANQVSHQMSADRGAVSRVSAVRVGPEGLFVAF